MEMAITAAIHASALRSAKAGASTSLRSISVTMAQLKPSMSSVQLDEPWLRTNVDEAKSYGVAAIDRALEGVSGATALHLCFGYAAVVSNKPSSYSFFTELEASSVQQISVEAAQPNLDLAVLKELPSKTIILGVLDLSDMEVESPQSIAARIREALEYVPPQRLMVAPDCGMKYLPREVAQGKLKAMVLAAALVRESLA